MPTNLAIDDDLLNEALRIGGRKTKRETVNDALREFVARRHRLEVHREQGQLVERGPVVGCHVISRTG